MLAGASHNKGKGPMQQELVQMRALTHGQAGGQADPGGLLMHADQLLPGKEDGRHICNNNNNIVLFKGGSWPSPAWQRSMNGHCNQN